MIKLNVGCGDVYLNGFINTDLAEVPGAHKPMDLRERLPFEDGSVGLIVASHVLELLTFREVAHAMEEFHRVLEVGGWLRVHSGDPSDSLIVSGALTSFAPHGWAVHRADKDSTNTGDDEVLKAKGQHGPAAVVELKKL